MVVSQFEKLAKRRKVYYLSLFTQVSKNNFVPVLDTWSFFLFVHVSFLSPDPFHNTHLRVSHYPGLRGNAHDVNVKEILIVTKTRVEVMQLSLKKTLGEVDLTIHVLHVYKNMVWYSYQ